MLSNCVVSGLLWYPGCCGIRVVVVSGLLWYPGCCGIRVVVSGLLWYPGCCGIRVAYVCRLLSMPRLRITRGLLSLLQRRLMGTWIKCMEVGQKWSMFKVRVCLLSCAEEVFFKNINVAQLKNQD